MLHHRFYLGLALLALSCVILPYQAQSQFTLQDSMQLHYPLDGNALDESGNGFDGTIWNAVPTTDRYGNDSSAYDFDGAGDWIDLDETFDYQERTVTGWAYTRDTTDDQFILNQDAASLTYGAFAYRYDEGDIKANAGGEGAVVISPFDTLPRWTHVAMIRNATTSFYYLDGELFYTGTPSGNGSFSFPNVNFVIGVDRTEMNRFLNGKVDDVRILRSSQILLDTI